MTRPAFRSVNYGLRLDYFIISNVLEHKIKNIEVLPDIGLSNTKPVKVSSDHAPVVLSLII
jgi:exonuclease III